MKADPRRRAGIPVGALARAAFALAATAAAVLYVAAGARRQWDFETYYFAGAAFRAGLNPYALHDLTRVAHRVVELPFLYPPLTLALFAPLSLLPISIAGGVWLGLKALLLALLVRLWWRDFLPGLDLSLVIAVTLLGFDMSALWELRTGNVAVIEAALLWLAFAAFARGRLGLATYGIALAGVFKLFPAALLALIALAPRPARARARVLIGGGVALLAAAVAFPPGLSAAWRSALIHSPPSARVMGGINPSGLGLADWLFTALGVPTAVVPAAAFGAYLAFAAALLLLSLAAFRRARASGPLEVIALVALLWLLLAPRLMVYSFVMAVAPVLYAIGTRLRSRAARWGAAALLMVQAAIRLLPGQPPPMLGAASLFLLLAAWALLVARPSLVVPLPEAPAPYSPSPVPR